MLEDMSVPSNQIRMIRQAKEHPEVLLAIHNNDQIEFSNSIHGNPLSNRHYNVIK